jgi:hypothetical protein
VREEKILKQKQNKPDTLLEIAKIRNMYAPISRRFDGWSPCCKLFNEAWTELACSQSFGLLCRRRTCGISSAYFAVDVLADPRITLRRLWDIIVTCATRSVGVRHIKENARQKKNGPSVTEEMKLSCSYCWYIEELIVVVVKGVCWEVLAPQHRIRSCHWSTFCWCRRCLVSGAICDDCKRYGVSAVGDGLGRKRSAVMCGPKVALLEGRGPGRKGRWRSVGDSERNLGHRLVLLAGSRST